MMGAVNWSAPVPIRTGSVHAGHGFFRRAGSVGSSRRSRTFLAEAFFFGAACFGAAFLMVFFGATWLHPRSAGQQGGWRLLYGWAFRRERKERGTRRLRARRRGAPSWRWSSSAQPSSAWYSWRTSSAALCWVLEGR